ncbi:protein phosphatase 2C family protein [Actinidia rufa]|uniref:protein-serine/threonine phosphatase n=1 Tax=Actinidia rufa TaxID=165716 RepID=A0A7J0E8W7_9ERIC|nr:protein phosphatase 2C family protein [Actinidia rufa]
MPFAVALAKSPVFTPSPRVSPIFFKNSLSSPRILNLHTPSSSPSTPPYSSPSSSLSSSSASPLSSGRGRRGSKSRSSLGFPAVETPAGVDRMSEMHFDGDGYSVYCKKGRRRAMEDRYSAVVDLQGDSKQAFFGIFDGHGGAKAAEFAANNIDRNIMKEVARRCEEDIEEAVKDGYLTTDTEFLKEDSSGGTCCVTALIHKGDLVVSNAGDCRAVLSRGGVAEALTVDHRPCREDERERVENLGGYVDCCHGVWRIQGSLAVSRGIGDRHLKQWVVAEPETRILRISPECEFLILASDGLWEKISNQEAVDLVHPLCIGVDNPEPFSACKKLADLSKTRGSTDDISVMVIQLARFLP